MGTFLRDIGLTAAFVILSYAGGRKTDGYLIGLYGSSTCIGDFLKWWIPKANEMDAWWAKTENWIEWVATKFGF